MSKNNNNHTTTTTSTTTSTSTTQRPRTSLPISVVFFTIHDILSPFGEEPLPHHNNDNTPHKTSHFHTHPFLHQALLQRHILTQGNSSPSPAQVQAHFTPSGTRPAQAHANMVAQPTNGPRPPHSDNQGKSQLHPQREISSLSLRRERKRYDKRMRERHEMRRELEIRRATELKKYTSVMSPFFTYRLILNY